MRLWLLALLVLVSAVSMSFCQVFTSGVTEGMTASTFFDLKSKDVAYGATTSLVSFKNYVGIDVGLVTADVQNVIGVAGLGLNLGKILGNAGFDVNKILVDAKVGVFGGKYLKGSTQMDMYGLYIGSYIKF